MRVAVVLAAFAEPVEGVGPHRLEQPVAQPALAVLHHRDERLGDQRGERVAHDGRVVAADVGCRLGRERLREEAEPREQRALGGGEQREAPVDHAAQRVLARQCGPAPAGQQREALVEPGDDLREREIARAARRQLERERNAVEALAERRRVRSVGIGQAGIAGEVRFGQAIGEQVERRPGFRFERERLDAQDALAVDPQRFARRRQHDHARAVAHQPLRHAGALVDQVLAVVEQHQEPFPADGGGERVEQRFVRAFAHLQQPRDRRGDQRR